MKITHIDEVNGIVYVSINDHIYEFNAELTKSGWQLTEISWMHERADEVQMLLDGLTDNVKHPQHYMLLDGVQVIDVRRALLKKIPAGTSFESVDHWSRCWEYITRMWGKNGLEDAKKARVYLDWLIESMEK